MTGLPSLLVLPRAKHRAAYDRSKDGHRYYAGKHLSDRDFIDVSNRAIVSSLRDAGLLTGGTS